VNAIALLLILSSLFAFVAGQLVLKRAMERMDRKALFAPKFTKWFAGGILLMTVSFFLSLGLLQRFELSYYFPFQGLSVIIVSLAAALLLKEKLSFRLVIGALLISGGIVLVSTS
jgi:drug/metabolite transporter (DMT)-like permease